MTTALEADVRDALASQAARLDLSTAVSRVRAVDYRPRHLGISRRLSLGAAAGSATAGTVVAVVLLGGAQPAFAGWTAAPTTPTSAETATAADSCQSSLADGPYTLVAGQVSSAVTGVALAETDGTQVVATVANGWVIAWWPNDNGIASAAVTTASGTTNEALTNAGPPPITPGSPAICTSGPTSSASGSCSVSGSAG